jgi:hypothetical protein
MSVIFVRCGSSCFWLVSSSMSIRDSIIISHCAEFFLVVYYFGCDCDSVY